MRIRQTNSPVEVLAGADVRAESDADGMNIGGYAIRFEQPTMLGRLMFDDTVEIWEVMAGDLRLAHFRDNAQVLNQHRPDQILADEATNTASFNQDSSGYYYRAELDPSVSYAVDAYRNIASRKVKDSSFGFLPKPDGERLLAGDDLPQDLQDREAAEGVKIYLWRVEDIVFYEASPVSRGAYSGASVGVRQVELEPERQEQLDRHLEQVARQRKAADVEKRYWNLRRRRYAA